MKIPSMPDAGQHGRRRAFGPKSAVSCCRASPKAARGPTEHLRGRSASLSDHAAHLHGVAVHARRNLGLGERPPGGAAQKRHVRQHSSRSSGRLLCSGCALGGVCALRWCCGLRCRFSSEAGRASALLDSAGCVTFCALAASGTVSLPCAACCTSDGPPCCTAWSDAPGPGAESCAAAAASADGPS